VFTELTYLGEVWKVAHRWAEQRAAACLYLDRDETIPGCVR
jgi:hypothetical protein